MLEKYYVDIASNQTRCLEEAFKNNGASIANAHQKISDLSILFSLVRKQPEGFVFNSLLHDLGLALFHGVTGLYRQSYASQRIALENAVGALYYSAQPLQLRKWAEGIIDVSWKRVSSGDGGVFTRPYIEAFMPLAVTDGELYVQRSDALYSRLSDFVHKNIKIYKFDESSFTYDSNLIAELLLTFDELAQVIAFPFCVRYLPMLKRDDLDRVSSTVDALVGNVVSFQKIIGGQAE